MSEVKYTSYVLVCLFAAAVVALGAQELHQRFIAARGGPSKSNPQLLQELHGQLGFELGQFRRQDVENLKQRARTKPEKTGWFSSLLPFKRTAGKDNEK